MPDYGFISYTADEEEPNCLECDSCTSGYGCSMCGPEYGWNGYIRTVKVEVPHNG